MRPDQSSLLIKRQEFHNSIRRQHLDDYRRKKRFELFGFKSSLLPQTQLQPKPTQSYLKIPLFPDLHQCPYPFTSKPQQFMLSQMTQTLHASNYSIDSMMKFMSQLTKLDVRQLANSQVCPEHMLNTTFKLLVKIMTSLSDIPRQSQLRQQYQTQIRTVYSQIYWTSLYLVVGILTEQQFWRSKLAVHQKRQQYYIQQLQSNNIPNNSKLHQVLARQQSQNLVFSHPMASINQELFQLLNLFFDLLSKQIDHRNQINEKTFGNEQGTDEDRLLFFEYFAKLWYVTSLLESQMWTKDLFEMLLSHLNVLELEAEFIHFIINALSNFSQLQTTKTDSKVNKANEANKNYDPFSPIIYPTRILQNSLLMLQFIFKSFNLNDSSLSVLLRTIKTVLSNNTTASHNSLIQFAIEKQMIDDLVTQLYTLNDSLQQLKKQFKTCQYQKSQEEYVREYNQLRISSKAKSEFYLLMGMIFANIRNQAQLTLLRPVIPRFQALLLKQISLLFETEQSSLEAQLQPKQQLEQITGYCIFALFNLAAFHDSVVSMLLESRMLNVIINLWVYCNNFGKLLGQENSAFYNQDQLKSFLSIKEYIIFVINNIVICLTETQLQTDQPYSSKLSAMDQLDIIVQHQDSAIIKLLIHFLKSIVYQEVHPSILNSQTMPAILISLKRLLSYILTRDKGEEFFKNLGFSPQLSADTLEELLNRTMNEEIYGQRINTLALEGLEIFDRIKTDVGYDKEQRETGGCQNAGVQYQQIDPKHQFFNQANKNSTQYNSKYQNNTNIYEHQISGNTNHQYQSNVNPDIEI